MGHRNKGAHLTGQQADVYGVVLGRRSNQHQDRPWQRGSAPTLEGPISKSADGLECRNLHCTKNILVKTEQGISIHRIVFVCVFVFKKSLLM